MYCPPGSEGIPACKSCIDGYELKNGRCIIMPCICPAIYEPVCCHGKVYSNSCSAECDGLDADLDCKPGKCQTITTTNTPISDVVKCQSKSDCDATI